MSDKITCQICGAQAHAIKIHLRDEHPELTLDDYKERFPLAPLLSDLAKSKLAASQQKIKAENETRVAMSGGDTAVSPSSGSNVTSINTGKTKSAREAMHEVFKLGKSKAAMNTRGEPIPITRFYPNGESAFEVPDTDPGYVFNIEILKTLLLGFELNIPLYLWGHAGTGKTTMIEQICAHTGRPMIRIQHTANTEEAHIVGQTLANERGTYWEPGPLMLAMKYGDVYLADEYDFAHPSVHAVYQSVLEGKPLVTKEAPPEWRMVRPHENFRFAATGNTNGAGDESGLYIGAQLGNSANYSRFGVTEQMPYMPKTQESAILVNQAGVVKDDAKKLVEYAGEIRKAFGRADIGTTIGPRELIYAGIIGRRRGSWRRGLELAYINRLNSVDREVADGIAQRMFT